MAPLFKIHPPLSQNILQGAKISLHEPYLSASMCFNLGQTATSLVAVRSNRTFGGSLLFEIHSPLSQKILQGTKISLHEPYLSALMCGESSTEGVSYLGSLLYTKSGVENLKGLGSEFIYSKRKGMQ